jgi:CubicO group peptidase (beta-lactamase class C family)
MAIGGRTGTLWWMRGCALLTSALVLFACGKLDEASQPAVPAPPIIPNGNDAGTAPPSPPPIPDRAGVFGVGADWFLLRGTDEASEIDVQLGVPVTAFIPAIPLAGDWDGNGFDSIGLYDPRSGQVSLRDRNSDGLPDVRYRVEAGQHAVVGDFDGDGVDTIALWDPATGRFAVRNAHAATAPEITVDFGPVAADTMPVAGDFDGNGRDSLGVYRISTGEVTLRDSLKPGAPGRTFVIAPGVVPVAGDFDGDGRDTISYYDERTHLFHLRDSDEGADRETLPIGASTLSWVPLAGRWDTRVLALPSSGYAWAESAAQTEGVDKAKLDAAYAKAAGVPTFNGLVVVRHGKLVGEQYFHGWRATTAAAIKSVSKSILSAVMGVASDSGLIHSTDDLVITYLPAPFDKDVDARARQLTFANLLTMAPGFAWNENGGSLAGMIASNNWLSTIMHTEMDASPGTKWTYSSGMTHLFSTMLTHTTKTSTHAWSKEHLLDPLGISIRRWDRDSAGVDFGGAEVYMTPRDLARFGQLFLGKGVVDGQRLLSEAWVTASTHSVWTQVEGGNDYGSWWWQRKVGGHDTFFGWGYGGQFVVVIPDLDAIIVATQQWDVDGTQSAANADAFWSIAGDVVGAMQ